MMNVGIIGYGYWGPNLLRNFAETPGVSVRAISDLDLPKLESAQKRYPAIRLSSDYMKLIDDPDIHAIAIATPVSTHFELAITALKAGKHVWVEKPMCETALQAEQLTEEAKRRNLTLFVDHTFIYTGAVRRMGEIVAGGDLGKVLYYDSIRVNLGLFQRDVNVISDLAVHDFSILEYLTKEHPVAVSASGMNHFPGTPENLAYITLFYSSGMIAHVNVNWLAPVKIRQILLGGDKKMIVYNDLEASEKLKVYDRGVSFTDDPQKIYQLRVGYRSGDMWAPQLNMTEALRVACEHFAACVQSGESPMTDGILGLRVVEIIEAATSSMKARGETIHLRKRGAAQ